MEQEANARQRGNESSARGGKIKFWGRAQKPATGRKTPQEANWQLRTWACGITKRQGIESQREKSQQALQEGLQGQTGKAVGDTATLGRSGNEWAAGTRLYGGGDDRSGRRGCTGGQASGCGGEETGALTVNSLFLASDTYLINFPFLLHIRTFKPFSRN